MPVPESLPNMMHHGMPHEFRNDPYNVLHMTPEERDEGRARGVLNMLLNRFRRVLAYV